MSEFVKLDFVPGSTLAECHRQIVDLVRERDAAVRDADTLRQARDLAGKVRPFKARNAIDHMALDFLLDLLAPVPDTGDQKS